MSLLKQTPFDAEIQEYGFEALLGFASRSDDSRLFLKGRGADMLVKVATAQFGAQNDDLKEILDAVTTTLDGGSQISGGWRIFG